MAAKTTPTLEVVISCKLELSSKLHPKVLDSKSFKARGCHTAVCH